MSNGITVILANGDFPSAPIPLQTLKDAEHIVCCDGAALGLLEHGLRPDAVIGDLDSFPPARRLELEDVIIHVTEQDTNDLSKAFRYCMAQNWRNLVLLGATGKREDHTLGNISLLADFARQAPGIRMLTDYGVFLPLLESATIPCLTGQQISIFTLESGISLHSTGLKWPLNGLAPSRWWQATLNQAIEDSFSLSFEKGRPVIVFLAEERK